MMQKKNTGEQINISIQPLNVHNHVFTGVVEIKPDLLKLKHMKILVIDDANLPPSTKVHFLANGVYSPSSELDLTIPKKQRDKIIEPIRTSPKFGRNVPCPCGSEKKHKHCCLLTPLVQSKQVNI